MQRRRNQHWQRTNQRLGLDELMIVNPSRGAVETVFFDNDGVLRAAGQSADANARASASPLLIGADGRVYQRRVSFAGPCMRCGASRRRPIRNY